MSNNNKIKKILKEYKKDKQSLSEYGGYDDEFVMGSHYGHLMSLMGSVLDKTHIEYQRLLQHALPQVLDNDTRDDLITNIEKLKEFLEGFDDFLYNLDKKNKERFKTKKGDF
jgi:hypothetical protein